MLDQDRDGKGEFGYAAELLEQAAALGPDADHWNAPTLPPKTWSRRVEEGEGQGHVSWDTYWFVILLPDADDHWHSCMSERSPAERTRAADSSEDGWRCYAYPQARSNARYVYHIDQSGTVLRCRRDATWDQQDVPQLGEVWKKPPKYYGYRQRGTAAEPRSSSSTVPARGASSGSKASASSSE